MELFIAALAGWTVWTVVVAFLAWAYGSSYTEDRMRRAFADEYAKMQRLRETTRFEVYVETDRGEQWGAFIESVPGRKVYTSLLRVADGLRGFCQRDMVGVLTRSEFDTLRDELVERGFLAWRNQDVPQQGVEWTRPGLALLRAVKDVNGNGKAHPLPDKARAATSKAASLTHAHSLTQAHMVLASEGADVRLGG